MTPWVCRAFNSFRTLWSATRAPTIPIRTLYERIQADDMMRNAVIVATFAYNAATRDERLPRKPLPTAATDRTRGDAVRPGGGTGWKAGSRRDAGRMGRSAQEQPLAAG